MGTRADLTAAHPFDSGCRALPARCGPTQRGGRRRLQPSRPQAQHFRGVRSMCNVPTTTVRVKVRAQGSATVTVKVKSETEPESRRVPLSLLKKQERDEVG